MKISSIPAERGVSTAGSLPVGDTPAAFHRNMGVVAAGSSATFAGKLVLNALRLVTAVWLARMLGADRLGLYSLALSALNLTMGLALFGLDAAVIRYTAVMAARKDEDGVWQTLQIGFGITLLFSALLGTLLYALAEPVAVGIFHEPRLATILRLVTVFLPLLVINDMLGNALKGFKKIPLSSLAMFVYQPLTRLVLIAVFALVGMTPTLAVASYGLSTVTASLVMFVHLNRHFRLRRPVGVQRQYASQVIGFAFPVWLSGLMGKFQSNIQALFLGSMSTIAGVGIFSVASQITMIGGEFSSSINTASKPVIAELYDRRDFSQMQRIYQITNKWVVMVQLPIFLLIVMLPESILSIFGTSYVGGASALIVLAAADLTNTVTGMGGIIIDMAGYTRLKLVNSFIRLAVTIGLDVLLIPSWGVMGAAVALLAGEGVVNLLRMIQVYVLFHMLPYNRSFLRPLLAALAALAVLLVLRGWLPAGVNLFTAALHAAMLGVTYLGITVLLGIPPDELALVKSLASKLPKRRS